MSDDALKRLARCCAQGELEAARGILQAAPALAQAWPPLRDAAQQGHPALVELLLGAGASPDAHNPLQPRDTAIYRCLLPKDPKHAGHVAVWEVLAAAGADLTAATIFQGLTPLRLAAAGGDAGLLAAVQRCGPAPDVHEAAALGDLPRLAALLAAEPARCDARDAEGRTPLMALAASRAWRAVGAELLLEAATLLLDAGAEVNAVQRPEKVAAGAFSPVALWWVASWGGCLPLAELLLGRGSSMEMCAFAAAWHNDAALLDQLLREGVDLNARSERGHTLAHDLALFKRVELLPQVLEAGADPNLLIAATGQSVAHIAAATGLDADIFDALKAAGADLSARDAAGRTPLALARQQGHTDTVAAILRCGGADV